MSDRPEFRYHPDPVGTGSAIRSDDPCDLCQQPAGYRYQDAAAFLGRVGWDDVKQLPDAVASLYADLAELGVDPTEAERQLEMLHPDGDLTGYLFRCLHCGVHLAYSDAS